LAMLLNGANIVGFQVICSLLMGFSSIFLSIVLIQRIGLPGVIFGTLIAQLIFIFIPSAVYVPRLLSSWSAQHDGG